MAHHSGLFSGSSWIFFEKVMTKIDLPYITVSDLRSAGDPSPAIDDFKNYADDVWFCFRYNVFMSDPHALKIV